MLWWMVWWWIRLVTDLSFICNLHCYTHVGIHPTWITGWSPNAQSGKIQFGKRAGRASTQKLRVLFPAQKRQKDCKRKQPQHGEVWYHDRQRMNITAATWRLRRQKMNWVKATNCNAVKRTKATDKLENTQANKLHNSKWLSNQNLISVHYLQNLVEFNL